MLLKVVRLLIYHIEPPAVTIAVAAWPVARGYSVTPGEADTEAELKVNGNKVAPTNTTLDSTYRILCDTFLTPLTDPCLFTPPPMLMFTN